MPETKSEAANSESARSKPKDKIKPQQDTQKPQKEML